MDDEEKNPPFRHIAHDLNNIFTRILNSVELLKRKIDNNDDAVLLLNNIESSTYLASEIIEESISIQSKYEIPRRIKINSIIQDIVHTFQNSLKGRIEFDLQLEPNLPLVEGKYSDFYRIILNLITNSIDAIHSNGKIILKTNICENDTSIINIEITDTGIGIDQDNLHLVFQENFSTKSDHAVSGVGLTIVNNLVKKYDGKIELASQKGIGTTFKILFTSLPKSKPGSGYKSILIAEDENILRDLLTELLQSYGYNITTANDGKEAIELVHSKEFDLLIIDRKMPNLNGIDCISQLRKENVQIPIILASGSPLREKYVFTSSRIDKILNKPYNFDEMLSVVRELIG
jgi:two-component system, cell cycle sensor histidine kinase and response regulator CckA